MNNARRENEAVVDSDIDEANNINKMKHESIRSRSVTRTTTSEMDICMEEAFNTYTHSLCTIIVELITA